jgi:hypothetical protein
MFHIADHAVTSFELEIIEDIGTVDADGCIWYPNQKRKLHNGAQFNACDAFLWWGVSDTYGVQRVRMGSTVSLTRARWAQRHRMGLMQRLILQRRADVAAVFPGQLVEFEALGWHLLDVKFWNPGNLVPTKILPPAVITRNGTKRIRASVAAVPDEEE